MKSFIAAFSLVLAGSAAVHSAPLTVLTFEGLQDQEQVLNYYNGALGGNNSGPGPNYGITFGPDALAIISAAAGGNGNFSGNPSGDTALFFVNQPSTTNDLMNVAGGFTGGFSFYYSAIYASGNVQVYSGLNGTGTLLANLVLPQTPSTPGTGGCDDSTAFCPWEPIGASFQGTAYSVVFSGSANEVGFDSLTLGSRYPAPEPSSGALLLFTAGGCLFAFGKRIRNFLRV